jgi:hypothetical protein
VLESTHDFARVVMPIHYDHWSHPSAARTTLGFIRSLNEYAKQNHTSVVMEMRNQGLNVVLNCDKSFRSKTTIKQDEFEFSVGDNILDLFLPHDLEIDLKQMI